MTHLWRPSDNTWIVCFVEFASTSPSGIFVIIANQCREIRKLSCSHNGLENKNIRVVVMLLAKSNPEGRSQYRP